MMQNEDPPMERLEAAMAKARAARRQAVQPNGTLGLPADPSMAPVSVALSANDWTTLTRIEISPHTANRNRLGALQGQQAATPYDMLRARVLQKMKANNWTRLAITSPNPGCGKTTLSANLAFSLARQSDLRVFLMDFDLRRPTLAKILHQKTRANIADLLQGRIRFADHAVRYEDNLAICLNQKSVAQSSELLQSRQTVEILNDITRRWQPDIVIFDMPPLRGNDDTLGFMSQVDAALMVAAAESTTLSQIDICERELSNITNVVGVVLNKCRYPDIESGYGAD